MKVKAKMRYLDVWVYGKLVIREYLKECVDDKVQGLRAVEPSTICEETNIRNRNGVMFFVNDIVARGFKRGIIVVRNGKYYVKWSSKDLELLTDNIELNVVGNKVEKGGIYEHFRDSRTIKRNSRKKV